jgi:hypothetical protein
MQLWLVGGGLLGAVVGYASQKKANKNMGAVVGAGIGALAGVALNWQFEAARLGREAIAPYASEAAGRVGAATVAASQALTTPTYQQLPSKQVSTTPSTVGVSSGNVVKSALPEEPGITGSSIELLLDEAGLPGGEEDLMDLLHSNPFMD